MVGSTRKSKNQNVGLSDKIREVFASSQGFPIFLTLTLMAILFVVFRMKIVEIDYKLADLNREIESVSLENKELKARRAQLLSVGKLRSLAVDHDFSQPTENQIIVIR